MPVKQPAPQSISRLLRQAGFARSAPSGRNGYSSGFVVSKNHVTGGVRVRHHFWSMGASVEQYQAKLDTYAAELRAAGWDVTSTSRELLVQAKAA